MKPRIGLLEKGALLFIRQKSYLVIVFSFPFDTRRTVPRNLLVLDPYAEDERECSLPTVQSR